jgi:hypothetical protein
MHGTTYQTTQYTYPKKTKKENEEKINTSRTLGLSSNGSAKHQQ